MKKNILVLVFILIFAKLNFAQSVTIDPNSATNGSAIIKAQSTSAGTLIPNVSTAQRTAIASPQKGLLVFDTNTGTFWFYNGLAWGELINNGSSNWTPTNGNTNLYSSFSNFTLGGGTNIGVLNSGLGNDGTLRIFSPLSVINPSYMNLDATNIQARRQNVFTGQKTEIDLKLNPFGGNVGIGLTTPTAMLHLGGNMKMEGTNTFEFGAGVAGKNANAGKIGYQTFGANDALDIVGAGITSNRKIRLWAEKGVSLSNGIFSDQTGNLNIVPLGISEVWATENQNGLDAFSNHLNIVGDMVVDHIGFTSINVDDNLYGKFKLNPAIVSQYSQIVAIGSLQYSGSAITFVVNNAVSGYVGEITDRIVVIPSGTDAGTYYHINIVVDDFPLTGSSTLKSKVIFYGIK